jgi:hypothetical protein
MQLLLFPLALLIVSMTGLFYCMFVYQELALQQYLNTLCRLMLARTKDPKAAAVPRISAGSLCLSLGPEWWESLPNLSHAIHSFLLRKLCAWIWGFHSGDYEEYFPGCEAVQSGWSSQTFRRNGLFCVLVTSLAYFSNFFSVMSCCNYIV